MQDDVPPGAVGLVGIEELVGARAGDIGLEPGRQPGARRGLRCSRRPGRQAGRRGHSAFQVDAVPSWPVLRGLELRAGPRAGRRRRGRGRLGAVALRGSSKRPTRVRGPVRAVGGRSTVELRTATRAPPDGGARGDVRVGRRGGEGGHRRGGHARRRPRSCTVGRSSRRRSSSRRSASRRSADTWSDGYASSRTGGRGPARPAAARHQRRGHATRAARFRSVIMDSPCQVCDPPDHRGRGSTPAQPQARCRTSRRWIPGAKRVNPAFDSSLHADWPMGRPPEFFSIFSQVRGDQFRKVVLVIPSRSHVPCSPANTRIWLDRAARHDLPA